MSQPLSTMRLILASLRYYWRVNLAVALGVMAATAVLSGALVVGDSMRGSLRQLTIERLGNIDEVLVAQRFFRAELADELAATSGFSADFDAAFSAILLQGTLDRRDQSGDAPKSFRAGKVTVLGCDEKLWRDQAPRLPPGVELPGPDAVVLNQPLADELQAKVGDEVILRLPAASDIPADSPLGRKTETIRNRTYTVSAIIPADGLGRFALRPSQQIPHNALVNLTGVQRALEQPDKVNAIVVTGRQEMPDMAAHERLSAMLKPKLIDYGLMLNASERGYVQLISDRMMIDPATEKLAMQAFGSRTVQPALTYLANYILAGEGRTAQPELGKRLPQSIPYSTITAIDPAGTPPLGPFELDSGKPLKQLGADEIALNQWAFDDLRAQGIELRAGDPIDLVYFDPESTHGKVTESRHTFGLAGIVKLSGAANDRDFTPELKGVTDEDSIANWNPPFPYDPERVRATKPNDQDDAYWKEFKATPKGFVSLATGRKLWGSRFGKSTSLRVAGPDVTPDALSQTLKLSPQSQGFQFLPVKAIGLMAATGATPFNVLFLSFSFFIIAAAVMLIAILFRLGIDNRAKEIGILMATGQRRGYVRRLLLAEGLIVAAVGAGLGVLGGVGYGWLMLAGLRTWWLAAIVTPFLQLHVTPLSLVIGYVGGVLIALATIAWSLRQMKHVAVRQLLAGQAASAAQLVGGRRRISLGVAIVCAIGAVGLAAFATRLGGEAQAGAFFGSGALVLIAGLAWIWRMLRSDSSRGVANRGTLPRLAMRSGARNPGRSTLTIGLVAAASFLIVAISAFHLDDPDGALRSDSGDGGFALIAEADQPVYYDVGTTAGREDLAFDDDSSETVGRAHVYSLRVQSGDDASCLNLYQPTQPRMLGLPPALIERGGFAWSASTASTPEQDANPWLLLGARTKTAGATPVVIDQNTATYSLKVGLGETLEVTDGRGQTVLVEVVGLLKNSIFQGDLLLAERDLLRLFPAVAGYRYFLVEADREQSQDVAAALEETLGDYGFDTVPAAQRLEQLNAVQNTYLATFQSLGGLGLVLGTFGLAVVQLRSVLERRGELALMRATGFRRSRLAQLVMLESAALLIAGLGVGVVAALVAVAPGLWGGRADLPWQSSLVTLGIVLITGLLAGLIAVRAVLKAPLLPALRGE